MKRFISKALALLMLFSLATGIVAPVARATEAGDDAVLEVIAQLEAIDTLQQIQDNRSLYTVKNAHYDTNTTNTTVIAEHENARLQYETYVNEMFAARVAAQQAYDALTPAQQAQIDPALVEKLNNYLPTVFRSGTYSVTPSDDEYTFEAVRGEFGYAYEVSNHMVSGNIPQTFVLVDTADGTTTWTPSGKYVCGESNYDVTYCCDVETGLEYSTDYKRVNLEDSNYYGDYAARHIRGILQNSYPYITIEEMKANLKAAGLGADFVDSLTRSDIIAAVQMAVWTYANANDGAQNGLGYFASIHITKNIGIYFTPLHDHNNECWDWLPGKRQRSYDSRAAYRVNNLAYYLCSLEGVAPANDQIIISDLKVARADLVQGTDDTYNVGMYVYLNDGGSSQDDLKITVTSYHTDETGAASVTARSSQAVGGRSMLEMFVIANEGDTIHVLLEGTQTLAKGVYFYEPEGGRHASQSLVGVSSGKTKVRAEKTFEFVQNVDEMGLRIYKTETDTGYPLSDITFNIYNVIPGEGEILSEIPTEEEIAKYATDANLVASITTDTTGYAEAALEMGTYLVIEEHNTDKIIAPVNPFYIAIPMNKTVSAEDGTVIVETLDIVSLYPKNEPVVPPEEPPVVPPTPDNVAGSFEILKYDEDDTSLVLSGAVFEVYRAATAADTDTKTVTCNGIQYAVVPVTVNGEPLVLTTDENGRAVSPEMSSGTYFLVETKAPDGYKLRDEAVSVTVIPSVMTTKALVEISNQNAVLLPETGGIGTSGFLTIGSIMMIGAAILLITKKRMSLYE